MLEAHVVPTCQTEEGETDGEQVGIGENRASKHEKDEFFEKKAFLSRVETGEKADCASIAC
jgi:hypothetical protein